MHFDFRDLLRPNNFETLHVVFFVPSFKLKQHNIDPANKIVYMQSLQSYVCILAKTGKRFRFWHEVLA